MKRRFFFLSVFEEKVKRREQRFDHFFFHSLDRESNSISFLLSSAPPMGLYDDLPQAKGAPDAAKASSAAVAKAAPLVPAALAPAVRRMAAAPAAKQQQQQQPRPPATTAVPAASALAPAPPVPPQNREQPSTTYYAATFGPFDDDFEEYDPQFPNDFSALAARKESIAEEARLRAEAAAGVAAAAAAAADRERRIAAAAADAAAAREREAKEKAEREKEEEEEREELPYSRAGLGSTGGVRPSDSSVSVPDSERGMPLAAKMMARMGWEEGKGLGKQLQGAPLPLVAKKTSARAAVVVPAKKEEGETRRTAAATTVSASIPSFSWPPEGDDSSRVVLLTNVAPPGLPEEALAATEDEIGMAAAASGGLRSVSVFEVVPQPSSDPSDPSSDPSPYPRRALVRVFVEFGDAASSAKFARSVRGQPFFAGDHRGRGSAAAGVVARPFSLARLREGRLAPEPGDVP